MAVRIRENGKIFCAALNKAEENDIYLNDAIHYQLSVIEKKLITTEYNHHFTHNGEWWYKGTEPNNIPIDKFYYED